MQTQKKHKHLIGRRNALSYKQNGLLKGFVLAVMALTNKHICVSLVCPRKGTPSSTKSPVLAKLIEKPSVQF